MRHVSMTIFAPIEPQGVLRNFTVRKFPVNYPNNLYLRLAHQKWTHSLVTFPGFHSGRPETWILRSRQSSIQNHDMKRSEEPTRTKRRKIAVACDDCRTRKVRCDGVQPGMWHPSIRNATRADVTPVCGPCSKRADGGKCVYTGDLEKKRATQRSVCVISSCILFSISHF